MRVLLTTYGLRGDGQPLVGLAVQVCAPPSAVDLPPRAAELVAAQFDTVAAAAEECGASVATGVMPTGGWR
jgi:vancomycin aglycone glucosyltransferase